MTERSVTVRLRMEIAEAQRNAKAFADTVSSVATKAAEVGAKGKQGFSDLLTWVDKNQQHVSQLTTKIGLIGVGLVAMAGLAVSSFANFDQAMSGVSATGDDARKNIVALRDAAIDAGASTVYSATEAANAIEEMSKAGVSATDVLGGGLAGALDLAAAGNIDVADAAGIASTVMNQFNLTGDKTGHIADVLAASAGKANGEVAHFGLAMKYVGPVAAQLGISLEETSGTLAVLAQNGILADSAGTGLRGMLMSLTAPTAVAQRTLDQYGISAFDAQGKFVGLTSLVGQLHDRLGPLTDAQREAALGQIFGNEQITTAKILYAEGATEIRKWTSAVDDQGYAAEVAQTKLDNLKGDVEALNGALQSVMIEAGEGANGPLRELTQSATDVVNALGGLPDPIKQGTLLLVGGAGLVALGIAGLGKLTIGIAEARTALETLRISAKTAGGAVGGIGGALTVATIGVMAWADAQAKAKARVDELRESLDETTGAITEQTREVVAARLVETPDWWSFDFSGSAADGAKSLGIELDTLTDAVLGNADAWDQVTAIVGGPDGPLDGVTERAKEAGLSVGDYNGAVSAVRRELQGNSKDLAEAHQKQLDMNAAVGLGTAASGLAASGQAAYSTQLSIVEQSASDAASAVDALTSAVDSLNGPTLDVREAERDFQAAIDAVTESIEGATGAADDNSTSLDINTDRGRQNQAALDALAKAGADRAQALLEQTGSEDQWRASLDESRTSLHDAAIKFGLTEDAAWEYVDSVLAVPAHVTTQAEFDKIAADQRMQDFKDRWTNTHIPLRVDLDTSGANKNIQDMQRRLGLYVQQADGGVLSYFANGGIRDALAEATHFANGAENHVAQIAPAGAMRVWAEPETDGEAYIPLARSKRDRSEAILSTVAGEFGGQYIPSGAARYDKGDYLNRMASAGLSVQAFASGAALSSVIPMNVPTQVAATASPTIVVPAPSIIGAHIEGTVDMGNGLSGYMRAIVTDELADAGSRFRYAGRD